VVLHQFHFSGLRVNQGLGTERASEGFPRIAPAMGKSSLMSLVANTYATNLLDRAMRAEEFAVLDRLVASVPVRMLTAHTSLLQIDDLCSLIYSDSLLSKLAENLSLTSPV
jgi:hypothetical protein